MGIRGRIFSASIVALTASAALAQQDAASPYSLGLSTGRAPFAASCPSTMLYCAPNQGLNLSLVGRAHLSSFGVFGKLGATNYSRSDTAAMGAAPLAEPANGLSWGGGVSYDITPRLSATFEWISYDLKMPTGPVRSTSLGLQYRY